MATRGNKAKHASWLVPRSYVKIRGTSCLEKNGSCATDVAPYVVTHNLPHPWLHCGLYKPALRAEENAHTDLKLDNCSQPVRQEKNMNDLPKLRQHGRPNNSTLFGSPSATRQRLYGSYVEEYCPPKRTS